MRNRKSETANAGKKNLFLFLSILAVVAVSGCIVPGGDVFLGVFEPQRPATTEASADLITTQNVNIIPNSPVSAENTFTVSFEVKNNDEKQEVENVVIDNYDYGKCVQGEVSTSGVSRTSSSASVEKVADTNVFHFKTTCSSGGSGDLYVDEKMPDTATVCGNPHDYKIKDLGAVSTANAGGNPPTYNTYELSLTVDGHEIKIPYGADKYTASDGTVKDAYNCFTMTTGAAACTATYSVITYQAYEKIKTSRTNCVFSGASSADATACTSKVFKDSKGQTAGGCANYCAKLNTDCKTKCNKNYNTDQTARDSCINQCDVYKYKVSRDVSANCFWRFGYGIPTDTKLQDEKNYPGYDGQCCVCSYTVPKLGTKTTRTVSGEGDSYMPLQTELNEWQFTAPTNDDLGNMPGSCGIKYKITYDFTAKTQASIDVINADKLSQMQRAGETPSSSPTQSVGIGPIKVFFDFGARQPVRSGDVLPIFITVEDRGSGLLDSGDIDATSLKLTIPSGFDPVIGGCSKFKQSGDEWENGNTIPMIKKKSPQLRCSFTMPDVTDIKTFYVSASLDYTYKLDDEIKVAVNPTLER